MKLKLTPARSREVMKMAAPVMFAMMTQTFLNVVDEMMVGRLPQEQSIPGQTALGYSIVLLWLLGGFLSSVQVGTQAITARRFGEKAFHRAGQALTNSLFISVSTGVVVSLAAAYFIDDIFPLFDKNDRVVEVGTPYARYRMLGILSMVVTASYKAFFDGIGKTHVHLVAAVLMNIVNLPLNYVLIFGEWGFPEMGVAGAGLGSLISTYIGLAVMIGWSGLPRFGKSYRYYRVKNASRKVIWDIVRVSVPGGLATVFVMSGFLVFFKVIGMLDVEASEMTQSLLATAGNSVEELRNGAPLPVIDYVGENREESILILEAFNQNLTILSAATNSIKAIMMICFMQMLAMGTATATLVGQSLGAGKPEEASAFGWESVRLGVYMMAVFALGTVFYPEAVMAMINPNPAVIAVGKTSLQMMGASSLFIALGMILAQALFGAGMTRYVMWVEGGLHVVCLVPLSYCMGLVWNMGLLGVWSSAALYIFLLSMAMAWKFWRGGWQNVEL